MSPDLGYVHTYPPAVDPYTDAAPIQPDPHSLTGYPPPPYPAQPYAGASGAWAAQPGGATLPYPPGAYGLGPAYPPGLPPAAPGYPGYPGYPAVKAATSPLAVGSMVTSIVGVVLVLCGGIGVVVCLVGAILGHVARRRVSVSGQTGAGLALAGIIIGWIGAGIGAVILGAVIHSAINSAG